jgi:hypothetical protein
LPSKTDSIDKDEIHGDNNNSIYFKIKYDFLSHKYYLKDMGESFGTYIKIDNTNIKEKAVINIGNTYLAFSYNIYLNNQNKNKSKKYLFLKIINENNQYEPIILEEDKSSYLIGRAKNCDIQINDNFLSKINCTLYFENEMWKLRDGEKYGNNSSNGTWLYTSEDNEIYDKMIFKSNKYNFYCNFSTNF